MVSAASTFLASAQERGECMHVCRVYVTMHPLPATCPRGKSGLRATRTYDGDA